MPVNANRQTTMNAATGRPTPVSARAMSDAQRLLQAQDQLIAGIRSGQVAPASIEARVAHFPKMSTGGSAAIWGNAENRAHAVAFARELSQIAPNAVVYRHADGYGVTARENYLHSQVVDAQARHDGAATAAYAARLAQQYPASPLAPWARNLAGNGF